MYADVITPRGDSPRIHHRRGHCRRLAGAAVRAGRPRRDAARAQRRRDDAIHQPLGRRHAGAVVRGRGLRARDHAGSACARSICGASSFRKRRSTARWWWRIRATAPISSALPADQRPPAARRAGACASSSRRWTAVFATGCSIADEGHVEPRRVLPRTACAHRGGRRHHRVQQRRRRRKTRRHRDRLPRPCRARRRSRSCAASRAR